MREGRGADDGRRDHAAARPDAAERLIVALDAGSLEEAARLVALLRPEVRWFKVGSELFAAAGPAAVRMVHEAGGAVFLDLKWHDIPTTVAGAVRAAARSGVAMMDVHVAGGEAMLRAAVDALGTAGTDGLPGRPRLVGVTVLTSAGTDERAVVAAARLARRCGLDGVVAAAREAGAIKAACGGAFLVVTPGIRPSSADRPAAASGSPVAGDDQRRTAGPGEAILAGADHLVVGRPIIRAPDPRAAARAVLEEIAGALDALQRRPQEADRWPGRAGISGRKVERRR